MRKEVLAEGVELHLGDMLEILPTLGRFDLCLTDPPYGIDMANGAGGGGYDGFGGGKKRAPKFYVGEWDASRPSQAHFDAVLESAQLAIIWGGNYFSDLLPVSTKWLWWDKLQTMPSYSDGELAWTSLSGASTKKFVYNGSGLMAREKDREHATQKPVELMKWCIGLAPDASRIVDPFCGSGTSGVAAVKRGKQFTGIEIDQETFEIACRRVSAAINQPDLFIDPPKPIKQEAFI